MFNEGEFLGKYIKYESKETEEVILSRVVLAILRKRCNHDVAIAAGFINESIDKDGGNPSGYWLSPSGHSIVNTKCLKSHHKKYWMMAGKILEASKGNVDSIKLTPLPKNIERTALLEWMNENNLCSYTLEDFAKALGFSVWRGAKKERERWGKGDVIKGSERLALAGDDRFEELIGKVKNALLTSKSMPELNECELKDKVEYLEEFMVDVLVKYYDK